MTKLRTKFTFMADFLIYVLNWVCRYKYPQFQKRWKKLMLGGLKFVSRNGSNTLGTVVSLRSSASKLSYLGEWNESPEDARASGEAASRRACWQAKQ